MVTVNNTPIHLSDLNDAFLAVDSAKLECDGHTLMLSHALMEAKIPHLRFLGKVTVKGCDFVLSPHLWLQIDGFTVDYRLRMWINLFCGPDKASGAPHGIFSSLHYPKHHYEPLRPAPCKCQCNSYCPIQFMMPLNFRAKFLKWMSGIENKEI